MTRVLMESSSNGSDRIPFLNISCFADDFWSFNLRTQKYTVSPEPYVEAIPLDLSTQKFLVIASDGLWNVMSPDEVVFFIENKYLIETASGIATMNHTPKSTRYISIRVLKPFFKVLAKVSLNSYN